VNSSSNASNGRKSVSRKDVDVELEEGRAIMCLRREDGERGRIGDGEEENIVRRDRETVSLIVVDIEIERRMCFLIGKVTR
jgi:hypothetical protein